VTAFAVAFSQYHDITAINRHADNRQRAPIISGRLFGSNGVVCLWSVYV
jgi:hypothetical protein